jgi:hypothetical protein
LPSRNHACGWVAATAARLAHNRERWVPGRISPSWPAMPPQQRIDLHRHPQPVSHSSDANPGDRRHAAGSALLRAQGRSICCLAANRSVCRASPPAIGWQRPAARSSADRLTSHCGAFPPIVVQRRSPLPTSSAANIPAGLYAAPDSMLTMNGVDTPQEPVLAASARASRRVLDERQCREAAPPRPCH